MYSSKFYVWNHSASSCLGFLNITNSSSYKAQFQFRSTQTSLLKVIQGSNIMQSYYNLHYYKIHYQTYIISIHQISFSKHMTVFLKG